MRTTRSSVVVALVALVAGLLAVTGPAVADPNASTIFQIGDFEPSANAAGGMDEFSQTGWTDVPSFTNTDFDSSKYPAGIIANSDVPAIHDERGVPQLNIQFTLPAAYFDVTLTLAKYGIEADKVVVDGGSPFTAPGAGEGIWNSVDLAIGSLAAGAHTIVITMDDTFTAPMDPGNQAHVWDALRLTGDRVPSGDITSPTEGEVLFTTLNLAAAYYDDNPDGVAWAVRKKTNTACSYDGTNAVIDNVGEGRQPPFVWEPTLTGKRFSAGPFDVTSLDPGRYCFVLNPREESGEPGVREIVTFYVGELGAVLPARDYNPQGTVHTVSVDIGVDVAGIDVLFAVSGANPSAAIATTAADGFASFRWRGENSGTDIIVACIDADRSYTCDRGEHFATARAVKKWWDVKINGGGQIRAKDPDSAKKPFKVSFGGELYRFGRDLECEWQVNLHNVGNDRLDGAKFHTTECFDLTTWPPTGNPTFDPASDGVARFYADGRFNGEDGYVAIFRMEDYTEPGTNDTLRIEIYEGSVGPGNLVYDTYRSGDFPGESDNVGRARTYLDKGNIQIHVIT